MMLPHALLAAGLLALAASPIAAQQDTFGDAEEGFGDSEEGFGDSAFDGAGAAGAPVDQAGDRGPLDLSGELSAQVAASYDGDLAERWRGLNRARLRADGGATVDLPAGITGFASARAWFDPIYRLRGEASYTDDVKGSYARELDLREAYVSGSAGPVDAKLGRQTIVWGRADSLRVTDILTPVDQRDTGALDLGDSRRPVTASRLDYYVGRWQATAVAIHEPRADRLPPFGDPLYPADQELPDDELPAVGLASTQPGLAVTGTFTAWDVSGYWARPFANRAHLEGRPGNFERRYARLALLGAAASVQAGDVILRGEAARLSGFRYVATGDDRYRRYDALLGLEYGGISQTTLIAELGVRHYPGYADALDGTPEYVRPTRLSWVLRASRTFLREKLELTAVARGFDLIHGDGGLTRLAADYELAQNWNLTAKWLLYRGSNEGPLAGGDAADRVYTTLAYSF